MFSCTYIFEGYGRLISTAIFAKEIINLLISYICIQRRYYSVTGNRDVFFCTEEAHTVVLAKGKDGGGRSAFKGIPSPPRMDICIYDGRPPGSSGTSRRNAPSRFGVKKDIPIPCDELITELNTLSQSYIVFGI